MKTPIRSFFLLALAALTACGSSTGYKIDARIGGLADGTVIQLIPAGTHDMEDPAAEATLKDGRVTFAGEVEGPRYFRISVADSYGGVVLFLDKGYNVDISATAVETPRTDAKVYEFTDIKIEGSPLTDELKTKAAFRDTFNDLHNEYNTRNAEVSARLNAARQAKDEAAMEEILRSDAYKKLVEEEKAFFDRVQTETNGAILAEKDSWWGPFMMLYTMTYFTPDQKTLFEQLSEQAKQSHYGQLVYKELYPESLIGKSVPAFTVTGDDGKTYSLSDLLAGKKYAVIDFWASWCGPCRKEMPNLKAVYSVYADKGLEIIGISTDKDEAAWQKARGEEQLPWPNFRDTDGSISKAYEIRSIPAIFLVDSNGVLVDRDLRGEALEAKLKELLDI